MLLSVAKRLNLSPAEILVVGDRITDMQCAINAGNRAVVVSTQTKQSELDAIKAQFPDVPAIKRFDDVLALLDKIKNEPNNICWVRFFIKTDRTQTCFTVFGVFGTVLS